MKVKTFYRAHLVEDLVLRRYPSGRWIRSFRWVQGYSAHPDGRYPNYSRRCLRLAAKANGWQLRFPRPAAAAKQDE